MLHTARATHKLNSKFRGKSRKRVAKMSNPETMAVLKRFETTDQVVLRRDACLLPKVITDVWRECFTHLDLYEFQQQLPGDSLLSFLRKMRRHFVSVEFRSELLQEQLNLLDRSGIAELPLVRDCVIRCDSNGIENATQWPLHTLPKFFKYLTQLQVEMPVHVGFIEHFKLLKSLTLHNVVSKEALSAIWTGCKALKRLQLLGPGHPNTIGISKCLELRELTLNVASFNASSAFELLQMPQLQFIELQQHSESVETVSEAICLVLRQRALDVHGIQLHGYRPEQVDWLVKMQLNRCSHLKSLVISDSLFHGLDMQSLGTLPVLRHVTFWQCFDLRDSQVLHFAKACPHLRQLRLLDCRHLTSKMLNEFCEWRCSIKRTSQPLELDLGNCQQLREEFEKHFLLQSSLVLVQSKQKHPPPKPHVQFHFLRPVTKQ
ncbi:uncharacterized protein LOC133835707 [Drosophila sulfurigaster albostrigata]|uniref:uncharacterized protein LOC133835707 n=1 Tax=Drosophila sulfurigaster albostrigata TaxID=89887 RepID=UPI002D21D67E|nr:uncharacterized protein LOC133835707 [Drosophila sulfurigaster albostrigata]XP_062121735.1 uncharacterized protein LOC133835707 [Drosophila sulfurigaster albostrigata]